MKRSLLTLLAFVYFSPAAFGAAGASAAEQVGQLARDLHEVAGMAGLSVAVSVDGKIVFAEGFGYADLEKKAPVTPNTQFRTASVVKVITATALGRLHDQGKLELDAPIGKYVPYFPAKEHTFTPRQLAGHFAGLAHYSAGDRIERRFYPSVKDALGVFQHKALIAAPATRYQYSTHGFTLLSAVIEGASGTPFLQYMKEEVFEPLGMSSTGPDLRAQPGPEMSTLYRLRNGKLGKIENPEDPSYKWSSGGMVSTPSDLLRLARAYSSGFLSAETVAMMFSSQKLSSGEETGVGIGWRIGADREGRKLIHHAGSMGGARSFIGLYPGHGVAVAVMTNTNWSSWIEQTAQMLALPFLDAQQAGSLLGDGEFQVSGKLRDQEVKGTLLIESASGRLALRDPQGEGAERHFRIRSLGESRYALISWVGS